MGNTLERMETKGILFPSLFGRTLLWVIVWLQRSVYQECLCYFTLWSTAVLELSKNNGSACKEQEAVEKGMQWDYSARFGTNANNAFWITACQSPNRNSSNCCSNKLFVPILKQILVTPLSFFKVNFISIILFSHNLML